MRRSSPPRVYLGHVSAKRLAWRRPVLDRPGEVHSGRAPADIRGPDEWVAEPRRFSVTGADGWFVARHGDPEPGDGRQRWAVFHGAGFHNWFWGRDAAERAACELAAGGMVTR